MSAIAFKTMNVLGVLYVICVLLTFGLCFLITAKIALLFKRAQGDASPLFQIPKGFPRFKTKWVDRLVSFLILNLLSLHGLFAGRRISTSTPIPMDLKNIGYYLIVIFLINILSLSLMYLFNQIQVNQTQVFGLKKLKIAWYYEAVLWALLLLLVLYFGLALQAEIEMELMAGGLF
ncbi:MAG: beta-carotene 15,15'-monooxygenase [Eikenella sp.]|nr:beta-carotene 15,15'-monooxygenase [Eikenella sp.]